jgi:hypothetical protein
MNCLLSQGTFAGQKPSVYTLHERQAIVNSLKQVVKSAGKWSRSETVSMLVLIVLGGLFVAAGICHFTVRPQHFSLGWDLLGCGAATLAAFLMLLISDYVLHHAFLIFIPWCLFILYLGFVEPHFGVGMGVALWGMLGMQLRS